MNEPNDPTRPLHVRLAPSPTNLLPFHLAAIIGLGAVILLGLMLCSPWLSTISPRLGHLTFVSALISLGSSYVSHCVARVFRNVATYFANISSVLGVLAVITAVIAFL